MRLPAGNPRKVTLESESLIKKVLITLRVAFRPGTFFCPFPRTVHRVTTFVEQLKTKILISHLPKMAGSQISTIILEPPKCGSTTVREELRRILGDFEEAKGIVQVTENLSQFRSFLASMQVARDSVSPEVLILGHSGIDVFVRAGLRDVVDLDSCIVYVPTREESLRFESAVEYCKRVRVIPQKWTLKRAKFWITLVGVPNISANNVSLDWGPPVHFAPSKEYVRTAKRHARVLEYDISRIGNLISDVVNRHGRQIPDRYEAPRRNMRP